MDNTHIRSSFYTVYSQPDISAISPSRKLHLRLGRRLKFRLTDNSYKLPLHYPCHCNYSWRMWILSKSKATSPKLLLRSQNRKWITVNPYGKHLQEVAVWGKLENPPPRNPFLHILNLETSLHSLLSFAWTLTRPTNNLRQNIVFSCSQIIRVSFSLFLYFLFLIYYLFLQKLFYYYYIIIIFYENYFYFFMFRDVPECSGMFRDVPECSGMFRHVPCSRFYRRPHIIPLALRILW